LQYFFAADTQEINKNIRCAPKVVYIIFGKYSRV